jgi:hypothetical protein
LQPVAEALEVLVNSELDYLGTVPDVAQVGIKPADPSPRSRDPAPSSEIHSWISTLTSSPVSQQNQRAPEGVLTAISAVEQGNSRRNRSLTPVASLLFQGRG